MRSQKPGGSLRFAAMALALAPVWAASAAYRHDLVRARQRLTRGQVVQTAMGSIEFGELGQGPALLVVHGAGGGFDQGLDFGAPIARRGYRVIAPSRFGYLRTPLPSDASIVAQADAHAALLDKLGVDRVAILGASAGASSALQFALRHPDRTRALILLVPALWRPGSVPPQSRLTDWLLQTALRSDLLFWLACRNARSLLVRAILATPPALLRSAPLAEQERVDQTLEHLLPVSVRRVGLMNDAGVIASMTDFPLADVAVPTLVVGTRDDLFGTFAAAQHVAAHIPGARLIAYEDGGHLFVGHGPAVHAEIDAFLRAQALRSGEEGAESSLRRSQPNCRSIA